ncbi:trafficking protein particle complex subunit-like protein [Strigomonas culicis]|uniref:Trafficking protein particle complex subunit n=1 Tax=Strigomonas culicis TaxID=28005 RepID=S9UQ92_9TRYP|nr:trafficking protein particle complex subunit-like protein [Strigomonas culicis]|eukprot:EPY30969.1 trafficking protein particle complex subunit-like protein [Strigomonas culicis]
MTSAAAAATSSAVRLGEQIFDASEKVNAEFFAISYGALVRQLVDHLPQDDDVPSVNEQLFAIGHRIGVRLIEEYSVKINSLGNAPAGCRTFAQAAERVALTGLRMFLNIKADLSPVKDSADTFSIKFQDNPLNLFVELPEGPLREKLWYSNVLCGVISGALTLVSFQTKVDYVRDVLRGDSMNEITLRFSGAERDVVSNR